MVRGRLQGSYVSCFLLIFAGFVSLPVSLSASDFSFSSIIECGLKTVITGNRTRAQEEDRFDEFLASAWPAFAMRRSETANAPSSSAPVLIEFPDQGWSESADYEFIRTERATMIAAAEAAARLRSLQNRRTTAFAMLKGGFPAPQSKRIRQSEAPGISSTSEHLAGRVTKASVRIRRALLTIGGLTGQQGSVDPAVRLHYYSVRNGYHSGAGTCPFASVFPLLAACFLFASDFRDSRHYSRCVSPSRMSFRRSGNFCSSYLSDCPDSRQSTPRTFNRYGDPV